MPGAPQVAADFVRRLAELTYRLAAKGIVVSSLHTDWSSFGSWRLQAQRGSDADRYAGALKSATAWSADGPEVVRVLWDGRDGILSVDASPTRALSAPNEWKNEYEEQFKNPRDELLRFVEDYLTNRLRG